VSTVDVAAASGPGLHGLLDRLAELPDRRLLRYERGGIAETTYPALGADIRAVAGELAEAGVQPRMHIGLLGENSYEWVVCELALLSLDAVTITFPVEEFRGSTCEQLQRDYALNVLLLSRREHERRRAEAPWVGRLASSGIEVQALGAQEVELEREMDEDVFTMAFSSGTSGRLKCIQLSRRGTEDLIRAYHAAFPFRADDAILVVLPLSAFQQRLMIYAAIWHGFDMHLVDVPQLMRGLREMRPTILAGPPLFYEVLENRFRSLPSFKRWLLLAAGHALQPLPPALRGMLAPRVFAPLHGAYGGRARLMLSGSAPSRMSTLRLFRLLCLPLVQAYGLTETGFISWNVPDRNRLGSVGQLVFPGTVRLRDDGEIVVRYRNQQSPGYFGVDAAEEARTFLPDGSIATGDVGRFDEDGYLYIVGRKKEILITRGGYKLQPEPIEQRLSAHAMVDHAVLLGGDEMPTLAAIVALSATATDRDEAEIRAVLGRINSELPAASRIRRLLFTRESFTAENSLLTRNLKIDRRAIMNHFDAQLRGGAESQND
jgi:long-chain acyl-CoA synthetase